MPEEQPEKEMKWSRFSQEWVCSKCGDSFADEADSEDHLNETCEAKA